MKLCLTFKAMRRAITRLMSRTALCLMASVLLLYGSTQGCFIVGDLSGDCRVDIEDLVLAASQWMGSGCDGETGLVAHWKLDESGGSTAVDSSGSGYNGIRAGARWNPSGGVYGGSVELDGIDDYVWISQGYRGITGSGPRTCAAWIKTDRSSGQIMTWGDRDVDGGAWIVWLGEGGALCVDIGGGGVAGSTDLTDDMWHHIAVVSDGSTTENIVLFVDGRIETIADVVAGPIDTKAGATLKLGVYLGEQMSGNYYNGLIDDARIYGRVLTAKEVWSLALTGVTSYSCPDMNYDGAVNLHDFARLSQNWQGQAPPILISEFLADNESKSPLEAGEILDGNGESSDWIELYNASENSIDIRGWYLTDDSSLKSKWRFPIGADRLILGPGEYLIVFASGKTRAENPDNYPYIDSAGYLHTNFQLSNGGEYLALIGPDGATPIHEYNHIELGDDEYGYPPQEDDISYGFYYDEPRYFSNPTPGSVNRNSFDGFVEKPDVSVKGGCYVDGFDVTMSCETDGAFIRYTTDGTVPSFTNGILYTDAIQIDSLTTLIAKSFKAGLQASDARIETYIFVESQLAPFNSNLPIIVVDTLGETIPQDKVNKPWTHCRAVIIDTDDLTGRADITGPEHFEGIGQIRYRGESTYGTRRHFAFEVQDEYGDDKDVSLLGMPAESDWVITGERLDYTLLKCEVAFKWFRDMGHYAPRQRYVEMYVNEGGGKVSTSDYRGIFVLREKIKRGKNRVDIARLDAAQNLEPKVSGGYIIKCDKYNAGDTLLADGIGGVVDPDYLETSTYNIHVTGNGKPILTEPDSMEVTDPQIEWIAGYINEFHSVLWQNQSSSYYPGSALHYSDYIDVTSWIDHFIVEQAGADSDAFWGSYYTHKDRNGKIFSGPPWDFDRGFHNNGGSSNSYTNWKSNGAIFGKWHQELQTDPEYSLMLADRWFEHRKDALNTEKTLAHIDETVVLITEAMGRSIEKYGFPGSGGDYAGEVNLLKNWIGNRLDWLDGEIVDRFAQRPPVFSRPGGYVDKGTSVQINEPLGVSGTIYYTLNGEDPRLPGGSINPDAHIFNGASQIVLDKSTCVIARIKDGSEWSACNRAVYAVGPIVENLRISELMYHPSDPNTEFIELQNIGTDAINLTLVQFTKGIEFVCEDVSLAAGEYGLIVQNHAAFAARYGTGLNVIGQYLGRLDNDGDRIEFKDAVGTIIQSFQYEDNWYELTDGVGFSLTAVNPADTDPNNWDHKYGWRSSLLEGGTPGYGDTALAADSIVINEILAHSHDTDPDWIELYNTTDNDINIGGWFLSDDDSDPNAIRKYEIPLNTTIRAKDYLVFIEILSFGAPSLPVGNGFGLSEAGETLYLYSGENGQITGYYQTQQKFDASERGVTFGRYEKEELSGGYDFVRMAQPSSGTANSGPLIPDIVTTEIHYNPANGTAYEFVELYNRSGSDVTLMTQVTTEISPGVVITEDIPWRLEGTGYEFPANTVIGAGEYILVAKDPSRHSGISCDVYGPYDGKLDNGGEEIAIQVPGDKEYGEERYWIPIEQTDYSDQAPWPISADGDGDSLHRINTGSYGRDYSNWQAAIPTPGS